MNTLNTDALLTIINVLLGFISLVLVVLGFFVKGLISRLEAGNQKLITLDKNMAVLITEFSAQKELNKMIQEESPFRLKC